MIEKVNPCHPDKVADRIAGIEIGQAVTVTAEAGKIVIVREE